jgi:hypothetical protein
MLDRIAQEWREFAAKVVRPQATAEEREALRWAFYGGMLATAFLIGNKQDELDPLVAEIIVEGQHFIEDVIIPAGVAMELEPLRKKQR